MFKICLYTWHLIKSHGGEVHLECIRAVTHGMFAGVAGVIIDVHSSVFQVSTLTQETHVIPLWETYDLNILNAAFSISC